MTEKNIELEGVDPREFYGTGNSHLAQISSIFPKLKLVARGSSLKVLGEKKEADKFEKRFEALLKYYSKYGHISPEVIDQLMRDGMKTEDAGAAGADVILYGNNGNVIRARTANQRKLVKQYDTKDLIFAIGPAGSGKTYTAIALAVRALRNKEVKRIILTRPAVEAGEKLGFLPGDMKEKLDPYLQPLYDALNDMIPAAKLAKFIEEGTVQIAPLAYMRGRTLDNAFVILDEAQNTTLPQIKMFLTRMGRNAKFIVTGDITQVDLPRPSDSGLTKALELVTPIKGIGAVMFDKGDIVRHPLVKQIVEVFDRYTARKMQESGMNGSLAHIGDHGKKTT
ncbi:MAG: PhoH family protein [Alistipes sp.]|nr:PhoH family protein [Alistipes sp.]